MATNKRPSTKEIHNRFISALDRFIIWHSSLVEKPLLIDLRLPLPKKVRVYAYNATHPPGGRTLGEHKIQLIVPGQQKRERASFDFSGGRMVLLVGYAADSEVFILWDAGLYPNFSHSRNVQVHPETIVTAIVGKIGTQERRIRGQGIETVVTANSAKLADALKMRVELTRKRLIEE